MEKEERRSLEKIVERLSARELAIHKLSEILEKYKDKEIPREEVSTVSGELLISLN